MGLLNTYLLCHGHMMPDQLEIEIDQEAQFRCAGFVVAEIDRFRTTERMMIEESNLSRKKKDQQGIVGSISHPTCKVFVSRRLPPSSPPSFSLASCRSKKKCTHEILCQTDCVLHFLKQTTATRSLRAQEEFEILMTTFMKSICCGLIDFQHSNVILPYFNRFGRVIEIGSEVLMNCIKTYVSIHSSRQLVLTTLVSQALKEVKRFSNSVSLYLLCFVLVIEY